MHIFDFYYTIPRKIRELQLLAGKLWFDSDYTIPRKIRELQLGFNDVHDMLDYTIPRKIRELQFVEDCFGLRINYTIPRKISPITESRRADIWCAEVHFPCVLSIPYFSFLCKETSPDRFSVGLFFCIAIRFQTSCWIKFCFPPYEIPYISIQSLTCKK